MANQALHVPLTYRNSQRHQNDSDSNSSAHSSADNRMAMTLSTRENVLSSATAAHSSTDTTRNPAVVQRTVARPVPPHQLQGTLDKITASVNAILAEQQRQADMIEQLMQSSFSIEKSGYKDDLLHESGTLFCTTINRLPEQKNISDVVNKVLREQIRKKYKRNAALAFVKGRLGELRAEERRRVFGVAPCQLYTTLKCDGFVDKFLPLLKVNRDEINNYHFHVAVFRKYCRTVFNSKTNTYKGFDQWLRMNYANGIPSNVELEAALQEEDSVFGPTEYSDPHPAEDSPRPAEDSPPSLLTENVD